jgi:hypothetical protein
MQPLPTIAPLILYFFTALAFCQHCAAADPPLPTPSWITITPGTCLTYDLSLNGDGPVQPSHFRVAVDVVSLTHDEAGCAVTGEVQVLDGPAKVLNFDVVASYDGKTLEIEGQGVTVSVSGIGEQTPLGKELAFDVQAAGIDELPKGILRVTGTNTTLRTNGLVLEKVTAAKLQWDYCKSSGQVMVAPRYGLARLSISATWGSGLLKLVDVAEENSRDD